MQMYLGLKFLLEGCIVSAKRRVDDEAYVGDLDIDTAEGSVMMICPLETCSSMPFKNGQEKKICSALHTLFLLKNESEMIKVQNLLMVCNFFYYNGKDCFVLIIYLFFRYNPFF